MFKTSHVKLRRRAFTLVEMLVVVAIIGVLIALLLPAIQSAREAARRAACSSNIRQIGVAIQNFESGKGAYPPTRYGTGGWSILALITPYLEQDLLFDNMNFNVSYGSISINGKKLSAHRVPVYQCPSEVQTQLRIDGANQYIPNNYAVNAGTWLVWDPAGDGGKGVGGDGAFHPVHGVRTQQIGDGLSNTLCASEVKTYTPYFRNSGPPTPDTIPASPAAICALGTGEFKTSGHTEWTDGRVHHAGFTTVFTPNTDVPCNGEQFVDFNTWQEGKTPNPGNNKTYAAVTARSHHPGLVQVAMMEASVRTISNDIDLATWRAMSTRNGKDTAALSP